MPDKWSDNDERQYEQIKESMSERGAGAKRAKDELVRALRR
ncbi:MAG TPA: hypothetical protein VMM35_13235 [Longimicrobiales bacterium]|nr:hypothetical protein [Longimicrobiales bacterium]